MRTSRSVLLMLGCCALGGVLGWAVGKTASAARSDAAAAAVVLPAGDIEHGRGVFLAHGCALCHGATGEAAFPTPASASRGPEIGAQQADWSGPALARAIVDPSHDVPPEFRRERAGDDGAEASPMADYADALTVQDLADLVAYIRYLGE